MKTALMLDIEERKVLRGIQNRLEANAEWEPTMKRRYWQERHGSYRAPN
jgi:hypothetical protein